MFYNYTCPKFCKTKQLNKKLRKRLVIEKHPKGILVWTEQHGMNDKPQIKCPVCGIAAVMTWHGTEPTFYIRGNCYLNKGDCRRQMDLHLLETGNDPYKKYRKPGETDDLKSKLKKMKTKR